MALTKNIQVQFAGKQIDFENAYIKVMSAGGSKNEATASVSYFDKQNGSVFKQSIVSFLPTMDGGNFIKQAYEHLKTLEEFAGAVDC
jgi:hypothetical protein